MATIAAVGREGRVDGEGQMLVSRGGNLLCRKGDERQHVPREKERKGDDGGALAGSVLSLHGGRAAAASGGAAVPAPAGGPDASASRPAPDMLS